MFKSLRGVQICRVAQFLISGCRKGCMIRPLNVVVETESLNEKQGFHGSDFQTILR